MTADAAALRLFVDESAMGLGKALAIARRDVIHCGHPLLPEVPPGCADPDWIPAIAAKGLAVIARDKRLRTKPIELALLKRHKMRVFSIAGKKDLATWDYLVRVVRRWGDIERILEERPEGPWFMNINETGITEIELP